MLLASVDQAVFRRFILQFALTAPSQGVLTHLSVAQLAALECADEVDPVARQIGAVNTLVRQQDGALKGYNTDWSAAITAIEQGLQSKPPAQHSQHDANTESASTQLVDSASGLGAEEATTSGQVWSSAGQGEGQGGSVLTGKTVVVIGAGGAGRALAFGAAHRGAKVIIANRYAILTSPYPSISICQVSLPGLQVLLLHNTLLKLFPKAACMHAPDST